MRFLPSFINTLISYQLNQRFNQSNNLSINTLKPQHTPHLSLLASTTTMKTTTILSTLALFSATTFAAPAPIPQTSTPPTQVGPFGLMSLRSASDIHFAQINARGSKFWIGKDAHTYCPVENEEIPCSTFGNTTQLRLNGDSLSLDVGVPGTF